MIDRQFARGAVLAAIALAFGWTARRYPVGTADQPGPGLFPLMASAALGVVALLIAARGLLAPSGPLVLPGRHIALVLAALCAFAALSKWVDMTAGIVALVALSSLASSARSWQRSLKVMLGLLAMAFALRELLGLRLPLL